MLGSSDGNLCHCKEMAASLSLRLNIRQDVFPLPYFSSHDWYGQDVGRPASRQSLFCEIYILA